MSLFRITALGVLWICIAPAKDKPTIKIRVVETQSSIQETTRQIPGKAEEATTKCVTQPPVGPGQLDPGIILGTPGGTTTCKTTTTPAVAPRDRVISTEQENVFAVMPDGKHITIWCQRGFRRCASLDAGTYVAQVDGDTVLMQVPDLSGKMQKIKYRYAGRW